MQPIRFETRLTFSKKSKPITPAQAVFKIITSPNSKPITPPFEPGVEYNNESTKNSIKWDYDSCSVLYEKIDSPDTSISDTISVLENINKAAPIGQLGNTILTMYWYMPTKIDNFHDLEKKYRNRVICSLSICEGCLDSSVILELAQDKNILHHQSGPMELTQLQNQYSKFKRDDKFPKLIIFLETSFIRNEVLQYSPDAIKGFLNTSYKKCLEHSNQFEKIMEEIL